MISVQILSLFSDIFEIDLLIKINYWRTRKIVNKLSTPNQKSKKPAKDVFSFKPNILIQIMDGQENSENYSRFLILGGGISGLSAASTLAQRGIKDFRYKSMLMSAKLRGV